MYLTARLALLEGRTTSALAWRYSVEVRQYAPVAGEEKGHAETVTADWNRICVRKAHHTHGAGAGQGSEGGLRTDEGGSAG